MSFEKASFSKEPIKPTQEMLNINLEKELHWVLNKELSEKEEILKWETKEKKDILNKEYLSYTIWKHLTLSSIWLNNDISYKINWKEIEINNEVFTLPIELNDELIISWIEDYFKEEYFRDHLWEKNIVEYTVNNLLIDNLEANEIKEISKNPQKLLEYMESKLWKNTTALINALWEDFLKDLWIWIQALAYTKTWNENYLDQKWGFQEWVKNLIWEEYAKNFENINPLLKTTVIWWGSIYAAFKLFSWVSDKMKWNWLKVIFGWLAVELIGQVVSGKSITWETLNKVWDIFQWTNNEKELKKQAKLLEKNRENINLGEFRALTYMTIWNADIWLDMDIDTIKKSANTEIVDFLISKNNSSKDELYKNVLFGHTNMILDIKDNTWTRLDDKQLWKIQFNNSESKYSEKMITLQERSYQIKDKISSLSKLWWSIQTIQKTFSSQISEYLNTWNEDKIKEMKL